MNTIKKPESDTTTTDIVTRRWMLWWLVATLLTWALVAGHVKENNMTSIDLGDKYSHLNPNFVSFFMSVSQDHSAPWSRDNGGGKYLIVDTEKEWEYYVVSLLWDRLTITLSSYNDEFLCRYNINTTMLDVKWSMSPEDVDEHIWRITGIIKKQYPNF